MHNSVSVCERFFFLLFSSFKICLTAIESKSNPYMDIPSVEADYGETLGGKSTLACFYSTLFDSMIKIIFNSIQYNANNSFFSVGSFSKFTESEAQFKIFIYLVAMWFSVRWTVKVTIQKKTNNFYYIQNACYAYIIHNNRIVDDKVEEGRSNIYTHHSYSLSHMFWVFFFKEK